MPKLILGIVTWWNRRSLGQREIRRRVAWNDCEAGILDDGATGCGHERRLRQKGELTSIKNARAVEHGTTTRPDTQCILTRAIGQYQ